MAATKTAKRSSSKVASKPSGSSKSGAKKSGGKQIKSAAKQGRSASSLKTGDKVEWSTSQGKTKGTVKGKVSKDTKVKGFKVKASSKNPKVMVQSDKTGQKAAHSEKSLKKVSKQ